MGITGNPYGSCGGSSSFTLFLPCLFVVGLLRVVLVGVVVTAGVIVIEVVVIGVVGIDGSIPTFVRVGVAVVGEEFVLPFVIVVVIVFFVIVVVNFERVSN